jgi:predicted metalloendopeptidase
LGRYFVLKHFDEKSKEYADDLIKDIEDAFASHLPEVKWMDQETRTAALQKMNSIINKIGYPNTWTDYSR